jgi:L-ribulose-5-phosphate 3-epimerase
MKIGFMQGRLSPIIDNKIQSFPWSNWQQEIEIASKNNISIIEWTIDDDRLYENPLLTDKGQEEINFLTKKNKVKIPSLTGDCFMQNPFWKAQGELKKKLEKDFINILYACKKTSISIILIPLVDNGSIENEEQEEDLFAILSSKKNLIKELSLRVCFESDFPPQKLNKFISRYDEQFFGINYDIGNSAAMGFDPCEEFQEYGDRIINVHIKDRPFGGTTVPLGDGNADFDVIFSLLKKYNYNGNLILQTARSYNGEHLQVLLKYHKMTKDIAAKLDITITEL